MPTIELTTEIQAPIEIVFDLSRSIDFHKVAASRSNESAIAGKTSGLIELGESVTWRAKHFSVYQKLTAEITAFNRPYAFTDEMVQGAFKSFRHQHRFEQMPGGTRMIDHFEYISPMGWLGKLIDFLFLKKYMTRFLKERNEKIKEFAENGQFQEFLRTY